ncbi:hypothetical protein DAEQUDRAFT_422507 [Daedalea quercina L-15889]|uniref:Uncharacterized protein n=1 Tax=Daedalea quercina L-15889 TaxID=1314783 RepID=A0A165TM49_9APHY|nr:hypothetical protein DAEQUDRAFT_422507 [Daedalea quercina L-15889]
MIAWGPRVTPVAQGPGISGCWHFDINQPQWCMVSNRCETLRKSHLCIIFASAARHKVMRQSHCRGQSDSETGDDERRETAGRPALAVAVRWPNYCMGAPVARPSRSPNPAAFMFAHCTQLACSLPP